jgi:hypothetical protein
MPTAPHYRASIPAGAAFTDSSSENTIAPNS